MSEIESKGRHSPGAWPGHKSDSKGDNEAENPRSSPAVQKHTGDNDFDDNISQDHYTHQRDSGIEDDDEPIEMIDGSVKDGAEKKEDDLKEVEPEPIEGGETPQPEGPEGKKK